MFEMKNTYKPSRADCTTQQCPQCQLRSSELKLLGHVLRENLACTAGSSSPFWGLLHQCQFRLKQ